MRVGRARGLDLGLGGVLRGGVRACGGGGGVEMWVLLDVQGGVCLCMEEVQDACVLALMGANGMLERGLVDGMSAFPVQKR